MIYTKNYLNFIALMKIKINGKKPLSPKRFLATKYQMTLKIW